MHIISRMSAAGLLLAAPLAFGSPGQHMDAADAMASVPAVQYESVLSGYQARRVDELSDWKEANANAGGGGHAGHGSHMVEADMDNMHQGHGMGQAMPEPLPKKTNPHAGH